MHVNDSLDTPDKDFERLVKQEELILDVTNRLTHALEHAGVTKSELAKRIGRTPGFVSQVFGGGRNLTLRTISDIAAALSLRPALQLSPDTKSARELESGWQQIPGREVGRRRQHVANSMNDLRGGRIGAVD